MGSSLNNGTAINSFGPAVVYGANPSLIAAFNGDGNLDYADIGSDRSLWSCGQWKRHLCLSKVSYRFSGIRVRFRHDRRFLQQWNSSGRSNDWPVSILRRNLSLAEDHAAGCGDVRTFRGKLRQQRDDMYRTDECGRDWPDEPHLQRYRVGFRQRQWLRAPSA